MNGVLIIDKPHGWTSHDVVSKARKVLQERQIGHTGTLDPLATGVLVLCAGKATRIVRYLESDEKEYIAEFRLGITTDTLDADGSIVRTKSYEPFSRSGIESVFEEFRGDIRQIPPAYSALKVKGIPSYRLARNGVEHRHKERTVAIEKLELMDYTDPLVRMRVQCSKGTYIRTLCADIGERLGAGAHLTALRRLRAGHFGIEHAVSMEQLAIEAAVKNADRMCIPISRALSGMQELRLTSKAAERAEHGNVFPFPAGEPCPREGTRLRLVGMEDRLIAIAVIHDGCICPETVLVQEPAKGT